MKTEGESEEIAEEPVREVGLGMPCRTLDIRRGSWGLREPWEGFELCLSREGVHAEVQ